jgi:hypothetical protein
MKKKLSRKKKTIKKLQLKMKPKNDRKVAPIFFDYELIPSGGHDGAGCTNGSC